MKSARLDSGDWAFGLADVLAIELQQRGVMLFERQQIRLVLGERQITASGLMQLRGNPVQEIPDLEFLVTGGISELSNRQFHLEASLVEARTGRNVASFAREGHYAEDLPGALTALAEQITSRLKTAGTSTIAEQSAGVSPGRTPEVNLLFYKGVAYCLAGQPELGVTWFIDAQKTAPSFLPARVWTMLAFEMLGLSDFAAIARARVQDAPNGRGVLNCLDESRFLNQKLVSVAVIADSRLDAAGLKFQTALKTALGRSTNLFVADPSNIRSLAAEMDLQLTEKGARDLEMASVLWSSVDVLVLVRPAEASKGNLLSVELRDAMSGEILFRSQTKESTTQLERLSRDLVEYIRTNRKPSPVPISGLPWNTRSVKPAQVSNTDRNEFAGLLKYLATNPSDRPAWMRLALFVRWLHPLEAGHTDDRYVCAAFDRVIAATSSKDVDAAHWISEAIWHKRSYENQQFGNVKAPSIAVEAAALFEHYPESPEAQYARSALAQEYIDQQKYGEAATFLLKLADELPRLAEKVKIGPDYWANFYFFTAVAMHQTGDDARARQFLAHADEVLRKNPDMIIYDGGTFQLGVWVNHFPIAHPLFGTERSLRQAVGQWRERLEPSLAGAGRETITLPQLENLLSDARQESGPESDAKLHEFLRRLAEHERLHPELYRGRITESDPREPWRQIRLWNATTAGNYTLIGKFMIESPGILKQLVLATDDTNKLAEARSLGHALADNLDAHIAANFFEATGEYDLALQKVGEAIRNPLPSPAFLPAVNVPSRRNAEATDSRRQKIRLLQALGKKMEAAAYARSQMPPLNKRPPVEACVDAAECYVAAGRPDEASRIFAEIVRAGGPVESMDNYGATVRIYWADYATAQGNFFEASEILRDVVKQSEGKDWGVYLRTGYAKAYDAAVSRLGQVRARAQFPVSSTDWEHPPQASPGIPASADSQLERELGALLRGKSSGPNQTSYGGAPVEAFIKKYGSNAVPAVIQAARQGDFPAHLIAQLGILERIATPSDAPLVLEAFKYSPRLAQTAFRLDVTNARVILGERFGIYSKGGEIPPELLKVVEKYHLKDQYPVLIANLAAKELNGNTAPNAAAVDRILQKGASPKVRESFRVALASMLEKQMLSHYRYGLASLGETAMRNGVIQGIEAVLRGTDPASTNSFSVVRKYIDLPEEDTQARAMLESGLGRWCWDPKIKKYVIGDSAHPRSALSQTGN